MCLIEPHRPQLCRVEAPASNVCNIVSQTTITGLPIEEWTIFSFYYSFLVVSQCHMKNRLVGECLKVIDLPGIKFNDHVDFGPADKDNTTSEKLLN